MASAYLIRWGALAAMLAGACWVAFARRLAALPAGCLGAACAGRGVRPDDTLARTLLCAAAAGTALAVAALLFRARARGAVGRLGRAGLALVGAGALLLSTSLLVNELAYGGNFPQMLALVIPGLLALVLGFLLLAIATLRAGALPRWASALLARGTLALVGFNNQNAQALLAIPFGLAWLGVGYALWAGGSPAAPPAREA